MANTYTQLYIHIVFVVKYRAAVILPEWEDRLYKYITGIVQNNEHKMLAINGMPDHIHLFIGLNPKQAISDLMRLIKGDSSEFINKQKLTQTKFQWQEGYGAFSNSNSQIANVIKYIINQKARHKKQSFKDEYLATLKKLQIEFDEKYIFKNLVD